MPRQARLDTPGTLHHVIIRGIEKKRVVGDDKDRKEFISRMGDLSTEEKTTIYAWALMSNHAHILLRSGPLGLSKFMRRLLTGYAVYYNNRHNRHGHLFQNRFKSIVCEEDAYFQELVRYIHLNPIRAGMVPNMSKLDGYSWCGHSVIMGRKRHDWQERGYVLNWFGKQKKEAKNRYRRYVQEGISLGDRPDLVGGGLIRSLGGWSNVISMRRHGAQDFSDERILGSGEFVEQIIEEAEDLVKRQLPANRRQKTIDKILQDICNMRGVNIMELSSGSRRRFVSEARRAIVCRLVKDHGIPLAEVARHVGVSTSAVSKIISREAI
ncbi:MAG: transposase [Deltaproteobacteria bacterium]|nr:transposase [Deltaproteobacteria bacterium]